MTQVNKSTLEVGTVFWYRMVGYDGSWYGPFIGVELNDRQLICNNEDNGSHGSAGFMLDDFHETATFWVPDFNEEVPTRDLDRKEV